jgi:glutamate racemase
MDTRPIGIFDSGSGGLSILQSLTRLLPIESTVYIGDHQYMPYGEKTPSFIRKRTIQSIQFLLNQQVKLVIVACNAATVAGIDVYRQTFPGVPIIGVVPVIKTAAEVSKTKKILVLSTPSTAKSEYQKNLITTFAPHCEVYSVGNAQLVRLVEEGKQNSTEVRTLLEEIIRPYIAKDVDTIVLGCTHFPFLRSSILRIVGPIIPVLDSGEAVSRHVSRILDKEHLRSEKYDAYHHFFTTGDVKIVEGIFTNLLDRPVSVNGIEHFDTIE